MRIILFITALVLVFASCREKNEHLSKAKMQQVLWDIIQLEAYSQHMLAVDTIKKDTAKVFQLQEKVFSLHGVTRDQYVESYKYYDAHPEYMREILDSITTRAQLQRGFIMQRRYGGQPVP